MKFIRDIINDKRSAGATLDPAPSDATTDAPQSEVANPERLNGTLHLSDKDQATVVTSDQTEAENINGKSVELTAPELADDTNASEDATPATAAESVNTSEEGLADEGDIPHVSERDMLPNWLEIDKESAEQVEPDAATDDSSNEDQSEAGPIDKFPFIQKPQTEAATAPDKLSGSEAPEPDTIRQATAQENAQLRDGTAEASAPSSLADARRTKSAESGQALLAQLGAAPQIGATGTGAQAPIDVPAPAVGRGSSRSGRVKTRLLGFTRGTYDQNDPFAKPEGTSSSTFPVAWLVVTSGPGRGASFTLHDGVSKIGRGEEQTVSLNFGDNSISRENHVAIAYDGEQNAFFIGHSGKSNMVRLNNKPLLSTEQVQSGDLIRLGETTLRFIAMCGGDFSWTESMEKDANHA